MRFVGLVPCGYFFSEGHLLLGSLMLLLELTLLIWPLSAMMARHFHERESVDRILTEVTGTARLAVEPYADPAARFRRIV